MNILCEYSKECKYSHNESSTVYCTKCKNNRLRNYYPNCYIPAEDLDIRYAKNLINHKTSSGLNYVKCPACLKSNTTSVITENGERVCKYCGLIFEDFDPLELLPTEDKCIKINYDKKED